MPNIYAIKARIKSVESTRQVTKSMKMVSTAKLRGRKRNFSPWSAAAGARTSLPRRA